jgi:hypothetical protein
MRRWLAAMALFMVAACTGGSTSAAVTGPADVAVQSGDLPTGLVKCDGSGSMDTFLNAVKAKDPATYDKTKSEWDSAKSHGATAAAVVFFSDSKDHCVGVQNSSNTDLSGASYPVVINFVIQFKDAASAGTGYTTESIFGFSESQLSTADTGVIKGTDTGLGTNSITLTVAIGKQSFYVAVWQNKAFMIILGVLNIDLTQSKKIATNENSRIH